MPASLLNSLFKNLFLGRRRLKYLFSILIVCNIVTGGNAATLSIDEILVKLSERIELANRNLEVAEQISKKGERMAIDMALRMCSTQNKAAVSDISNLEDPVWRSDASASQLREIDSFINLWEDLVERCSEFYRENERNAEQAILKEEKTISSVAIMIASMPGGTDTYSQGDEIKYKIYIHTLKEGVASLKRALKRNENSKTQNTEIEKLIDQENKLIKQLERFMTEATKKTVELNK